MIKVEIAATDGAASNFDNHICIINDLRPRRLNCEYVRRYFCQYLNRQ
jgi:hypothetical protein